ncbi:MAG: SseB family protein [Gammaproteobacteria bacterium]|nr:SseB family protein [Gammaproteobacteria bacterium]
MTTSENTPRNEVEHLLIEMNEGRIEAENFARALLDHQIFIPIQDEKHHIAGFQLSTKARPMVIEDEEGNRVLIAFSSPERAKEFTTMFPDQGVGYGGGLLIEASWMLRRMGAGMSLSINPGQELGFDFDADMVAMVVSLLPEEAV